MSDAARASAMLEALKTVEAEMSASFYDPKFCLATIRKAIRAGSRTTEQKDQN
jgi:hypothetical protein